MMSTNYLFYLYSLSRTIECETIKNHMHHAGSHEIQIPTLSTDLLEMPCKQLGRKVTIMLGDIGDARTCWMVEVLAGSVDTDYNKLD